MKKIIVKILLVLVLLISIIIAHLSIIGIETQVFNSQIKSQIKKINKNLEVDLKKIKIVLEPFNLKIIGKTIGPKLIYGDKSIEIETIKSQISLHSLINKKFSLENLEVSTKSLEIKNLLSFLRLVKKSPELYILERLINRGYIIANINLKFDSEGNIKNDYKIKGFIKDIKFSLFNKYDLDKLNFVFDLENNKSFIKDLNLSFKNIPITSKKISIEKKNGHFFVNGELENKNIDLNKDLIETFFKPKVSSLEIKKVNLSSTNKFSFKINKKFNINNFKLSSQIKLNNSLLSNPFEIKKFLPNVKKEISLLNHLIDINYENKTLSINGTGKLVLQDNHDKINYLIKNKNKTYELESSLEINSNPIIIEFLGYESKKDFKTLINLKAKHIIDKKTIIDTFSLNEKKNKMILKDLTLDKNFKINNFKKINLNYFDKDNLNNKLNIINDNNNYTAKGSMFNANTLIDKLTSDDTGKFNLFKNDLSFKLLFDEVYLGEKHYINNLKGNLYFKKNDITNANISAEFSKNKKFRLTINSTQNEKVTTLFLDKAEPIVRRYKFIKGYEGGALDYYSSKKGKETNSTLKIYNFKLKELPALTKLLTLASLQGIADILSGEGIRFDEFEMNFRNKDNLMTIEEIYAIGPAISILMDGYVEKNKIISLRGTLVPATTINKFIGSLPVLGKILVGKKTGEGVFGVSFKIKGPPKNLETTVNPIKTLTPRFITRTLEKIKKN